MSCLFTFLIVFFEAQKLLIMMKSNLSIFSLCFSFHIQETIAKFKVMKIYFYVFF